MAEWVTEEVLNRLHIHNYIMSNNDYLLSLAGGAMAALRMYKDDESLVDACKKHNFTCF